MLNHKSILHFTSQRLEYGRVEGALGNLRMTFGQSGGSPAPRRRTYPARMVGHPEVLPGADRCVPRWITSEKSGFRKVSFRPDSQLPKIPFLGSWQTTPGRVSCGGYLQKNSMTCDVVVISPIPTRVLAHKGGL